MMPPDLASYEKKAKAAVKAFWTGRNIASIKQLASGKADQGERAAVTGGRNMDGFIALMSDLVHRNGLKSAEIHLERKALTLPGYFPPTKLWDMLVVDRGNLIATFEFKSQVGPSFGNNFNNRAEEAIGSAHDFWTAYRKNAFGAIPRPFLGWIMLVGGPRFPLGRAGFLRSLSDFPRIPRSFLHRPLSPAVPEAGSGATLHRCGNIGFPTHGHQRRCLYNFLGPDQPRNLRVHFRRPNRSGGGKIERANTGLFPNHAG